MQPHFKGLLERKDPRALLLLAYWYAKVSGSLWWMTRLAKLECQATCLYLERHYARETAIQELLTVFEDSIRTCCLTDVPLFKLVCAR
jgi:hypothetical protein